MLVVHPHLHRRRTGVTAHVESVVPRLNGPIEAYAIGSALSAGVPVIGWSALLRRARSEPLVWHAHRNNELLAGLLLRLVGRAVRLVFTRHSAGRPGWLTRVLASLAHRRVALTEEGAAAWGGAPAVVSHGVDLSRFSPPMDRARAWESLGVGGRFGIGVLGRVRPAKGQGDFLRALSPLLPRYADWRAVLVGLVKPADRRWLEREVGKAPVHLAGEVADPVPWYRGLSIVVQPSHREGFSLVLLEAMASGCCVVAADLPHFRRLIEHGRTGFLYPVGDVGALREVLGPLLREPDRVAAIGRVAAEHAFAHFSVEREVSELAELYRSVLS